MDLVKKWIKASPVPVGLRLIASRVMGNALTVCLYIMKIAFAILDILGRGVIHVSVIDLTNINMSYWLY